MTKFKFPHGESFIEALTQEAAEILATEFGVSFALIESFEEPDHIPELNLKEGLRIFDMGLVHQDFATLPPSKLDFVRHLCDGINLKKDVEMAKNGRPIKATYQYQGINIAEIVFEFETDAMNFLTRRKELLGYFNGDDEVPAYYTISDWQRNLSSQYDTTFVTKERKEARFSIFDEIKSKLNVYIYMYYAPQGKTYQQILDIGGNFWTVYSGEIDSWINIGGKEGIVTKLTNNVDGFGFLNYVVETTPETVTVTDYILNRFNY